MTPISRGPYEGLVPFINQSEYVEGTFNIPHTDQQVHQSLFQGTINGIPIEERHLLNVVENCHQLLMNSNEYISNAELLHLKQQLVCKVTELGHTDAEFEIVQEAISRIPKDINTGNVLQIIDGFNTELKAVKERVGYNEKMYTTDHLGELDTLLEEEEKSLVRLWGALSIDTVSDLDMGSEIREWLKDIEQQPLLDKVTRLSLKGEGLVLLPVEMRYLRYLEEIDLGDNQITFLPEWISHFVKLKRLNVSNNMLNAIPASLCGCNSLEELYVLNNRIQEIPIGLNKLQSLRILCAGNNPLRVPLSRERASWRPIDRLLDYL